MSTLALWILSAGLATLSASTAGTLIERVSPRARARRAALRVPRSRIESARSGELVRIVGRVEYAQQPLCAPLSGRACAHYEAGVESPARGGGYKRTLTEMRSTSFLVVDDSGRALVDVSRVSADVIIDHYWTARDVDLETRFELERFLYHAGDRGRAHLSNTSALRYAEGAIEEGETLSVVGVASWARLSEPGIGYRDLGRGLIIEPPARAAVYVSDALHWS